MLLTLPDVKKGLEGLTNAEPNTMTVPKKTKRKELSVFVSAENNEDVPYSI